MGHSGYGEPGTPHDHNSPQPQTPGNPPPVIPAPGNLYAAQPTPPAANGGAAGAQQNQPPALPVMRQAAAQTPGQQAGAAGYSPYPPYPPYPGNPPYPPYYPAPGQPGAGYPGYTGYPAPQQPYPHPGQPQGYPPQPGYLQAAPPTTPFPPPVAPPAPRPRRRLRKPLLIGGGVGMVALIILLVAGVVIYSFVGAIAYHVGPFVVGPYERIGGVVYGQSLAASEQDTTEILPVAASVTCGGVTAHANARGAYSLTLPAAAQYICVATAPNYTPQTIQLTGHGAQTITLTIGPKTTSACPANSGLLTITCAALALAPATLHGVITDAATGQGVASASVQCWNDDASLIASQQAGQTFTTTTDATGAYTLHGLAPSSYACAGDQTGALHRFSLTAGQSMQLNIAVCTSHCPGMAYHFGQVMHTLKAYVVFWLPKGQTFAPGESNATFESLVQQYFKDVGGTAFYHLLTQYWDGNGPVRNVVQFGGSYVDTTPYPHAGSMADPLTDGDIRATVARAVTANSWPDDHQSDEVFVVTGYNIEECAGGACTFPQGSSGQSFCGYHDTTNDGTIYTFVGDSLYTYIGNYVYSCVPPSFGVYGPTPNGPIPYGNAYADSVINVFSHEQFESVTDPVNATGWNSNSSSTEGEIGDLCFTSFGPTDAQGATITLAHGHSYVLQKEFSNLTNGCAYS